MKTAAIEFHHLTKEFELWHDRPYSIKSIVAQLSTFNFKFGRREKLRILENIDLTVYKGDFVGIMGRNGVGKSTLLRLISNIYRPTSGSVVTHGRLIPLLELGAGFAAELTGYENIFLNASILGFSKKEAELKAQAIVDFSELKEKINQPVRAYSSGMLVRLGFSIAAHFNADLLLFDEILAVGDVGFQEKCLQKIHELHASGKTIVLVTHDPQQVAKYCNRCIVIEKQGVVFDGAPSEGIGVYSRMF